MHHEEEEDELDEPGSADEPETQTVGGAFGHEMDAETQNNEDDPQWTGVEERYEPSCVEVLCAEGQHSGGDIKAGRGEEHPCQHEE